MLITQDDILRNSEHRSKDEISARKLSLNL